MQPFGIRAKVNVGLGVIILVATAAFGTAYALLEGNAAVEAKREHLQQSARLARFQLEEVRDRDDLETGVRELSRRLSESTGAAHRVVVMSAGGESLATSEIGGRAVAEAAGHTTGEPSDVLLPSSLRVEVPLSLGAYVAKREDLRPARLVLEESLADLPRYVLSSLARHFAFAGGLVGLAMLCAGLLIHWLVVRPVRELVAATEGIGRDGHWEPIQPSARRDDEIGVLVDRVAELSRRLGEAVRAERYGSAHLVASRVRRELDEPLRHAEAQLAVLEKLLPPACPEARAVDEIADRVQEIAEFARRLEEIRAVPPS